MHHELIIIDLNIMMIMSQTKGIKWLEDSHVGPAKSNMGRLGQDGTMNRSVIIDN